MSDEEGNVVEQREEANTAGATVNTILEDAGRVIGGLARARGGGGTKREDGKKRDLHVKKEKEQAAVPI